MTSILNVTSQQLRRAATLKEKIDSLHNELHRLLGASTQSAASGGRPKRRMSRAGIARIRAAAKARWAKVKRKGRSASSAKKPRRKMSAAAKARLAAIARARWRAAKAAGKTAL